MDYWSVPSLVSLQQFTGKYKNASLSFYKNYISSTEHCSFIITNLPVGPIFMSVCKNCTANATAFIISKRGAKVIEFCLLNDLQAVAQNSKLLLNPINSYFQLLSEEFPAETKFSFCTEELVQKSTNQPKFTRLFVETSAIIKMLDNLTEQKHIFLTGTNILNRISADAITTDDSEIGAFSLSTLVQIINQQEEFISELEILIREVYIRNSQAKSISHSKSISNFNFGFKTSSRKSNYLTDSQLKECFGNLMDIFNLHVDFKKKLDFYVEIYKEQNNESGFNEIIDKNLTVFMTKFIMECSEEYPKFSFWHFNLLSAIQSLKRTNLFMQTLTEKIGLTKIANIFNLIVKNAQKLDYSNSFLISKVAKLNLSVKENIEKQKKDLFQRNLSLLIKDYMAQPEQLLVDYLEVNAILTSKSSFYLFILSDYLLVAQGKIDFNMPLAWTDEWFFKQKNSLRLCKSPIPLSTIQPIYEKLEEKLFIIANVNLTEILTLEFKVNKCTGTERWIDSLYKSKYEPCVKISENGTKFFIRETTEGIEENCSFSFFSETFKIENERLQCNLPNYFNYKESGNSSENECLSTNHFVNESYTILNHVKNAHSFLRNFYSIDYAIFQYHINNLLKQSTKKQTISCRLKSTLSKISSIASFLPETKSKVSFLSVTDKIGQSITQKTEESTVFNFDLQLTPDHSFLQYKEKVLFDLIDAFDEYISENEFFKYEKQSKEFAQTLLNQLYDNEIHKSLENNIQIIKSFSFSVIVDCLKIVMKEYKEIQKNLNELNRKIDTIKKESLFRHYINC